MKQYKIYEGNIERLRTKVNRIRNKCEKYGCDFHYEEVDEVFELVNVGEPDEHMAKFIMVEVEGTAIIHDWRYIGSVEHTANGNIINTITDIEVPKYYFNAPCECEHCHSVRPRKCTYLVYNEKTNEFKQVGSSCLCDFTSGLSAELAAMWISWFDDIMEFEAVPEGSSYTRYYDLRTILSYAAQYIKDIGYASTSSMYSTRDWVLDTIMYDEHRNPGENAVDRIREYRMKFKPDYRSVELQDEVEAIISYVIGLEAESSYENNLQVIAKEGYVSASNLGIACSMPLAYNRYIERETKRIAAEKTRQVEASTSEYVGNVKDRITINNPTVEAITSWSTEYGFTTRYKITADGNVYMWDSSSGIWEDEFQKVSSIVGTVKKHDEFRGVKQTWITRCRVNYVEVTPEHKPAGPDPSEVVKEFLDSVS